MRGFGHALEPSKHFIKVKGPGCIAALKTLHFKVKQQVGSRLGQGVVVVGGRGGGGGGGGGERGEGGESGGGVGTGASFQASVKQQVGSRRGQGSRGGERPYTRSTQSMGRENGESGEGGEGVAQGK